MCCFSLVTTTTIQKSRFKLTAFGEAVSTNGFDDFIRNARDACFKTNLMGSVSAFAVALTFGAVMATHAKQRSQVWHYAPNRNFDDTGSLYSCASRLQPRGCFHSTPIGFATPRSQRSCVGRPMRRRHNLEFQNYGRRHDSITPNCSDST